MNQNRSTFGQNSSPNAAQQNNGWNAGGQQNYDPRQMWPSFGQNQQYGASVPGYQQNTGMQQSSPWMMQGQQMPQQNAQQNAYQPFGSMNAGQQGGYAQNPGTAMFPNAYGGAWQNNQGMNFQQGQMPNAGGYSQQNPQYNGIPGNSMQPPFANAYSQMGRNQANARQTTAQQLQQNGYTNGYMPQNPPMAGSGFVSKANGQGMSRPGFVFDNLKLILLSAVLLTLFVLGVLVHVTALKWIFAVLALAAIVLFWIRPLIDSNKRLCFTVVFGLLLILALIPFGGSTPDNQNTGNQNPGTVVVNNRGAAEGNGQTAMQNPAQNTAASIEVTQAPVNTPGPVNDTATTDQLQSFFYFWSVNKEDEMLSLCAPSWQSSVDSPKTALFGIKANRTPQDYTIEKMSGTPEDNTRTVTLTSTMDRNNGKEPVKYRMNVLMVKENGIWYVDPSSLRSYDPVESPTPVTATATPTAPPVNSKTVLYYNPDGGSKYHRDQNCQSTNQRYLPLKGQFTYDQLNDEKYAKLQPCNVCDAPVR